MMKQMKDLKCGSLYLKIISFSLISAGKLWSNFRKNHGTRVGAAASRVVLDEQVHHEWPLFEVCDYTGSMKNARR